MLDQTAYHELTVLGNEWKQGRENSSCPETLQQEAAPPTASENKPEGSCGPRVGSSEALGLSRHLLAWPYTVSVSEAHSAVTCLILFNDGKVKL